jgi:hypothetical protein
VFDEKPQRTNLGNLSGFATSSLANDDRSSMVLDQVQNGLAVLVHGQPLSQPLKPFAKRNLSVILGRGRNKKTNREGNKEKNTEKKKMKRRGWK